MDRLFASPCERPHLLNNSEFLWSFAVARKYLPLRKESRYLETIKNSVAVPIYF